jgi:hypothetical protein
MMNYNDDFATDPFRVMGIKPYNYKSPGIYRRIKELVLRFINTVRRVF